MSARRSGAGARRVNGADHRSVDPAASRLTDAFEPDDAAIAQAVRAWLRSLEPSDWEIADVLDGPRGSPDVIRDLRDLYRRAWEATP